MEFLKRNWVALTMAVLSGVALLMLIMALALNGDMLDYIGFMPIAWIVGLILFFAGMIAYFVVKMLGLCARVKAIILIATGALATIFIFLSLIEVWTMFSDLPSEFVTSEMRQGLMMEWVPLFAIMIIAGLFPLIKGIKKLCCSCKKKNEQAAAAE